MESKKAEQKAQKLQLIAYTETAGNYKNWDEKKQKCYTCHNVIFNESDFEKSQETFEQELEGTVEPLNNVQVEVANCADTEQENT